MTGRIRTLKPEWLDDELLAAASDEARVLSAGLILIADDYGNGRASMAGIAAAVWRFELERNDGAGAPEVFAKASRAFRELVAIGFMGEWLEGGQRYFAIRNWTRHQRVDKPGKPLVPKPPADLFKARKTADSRTSRESLATPSRAIPESFAPDLDQRPGPVPGKDLEPLSARALARPGLLTAPVGPEPGAAAASAPSKPVTPQAPNPEKAAAAAATVVEPPEGKPAVKPANRTELPSNLEQALELAICPRAQVATEHPERADWLQPHKWPELVLVATALHEACGLGEVRVGSYARDSGVRAIVELFAAGYMPGDLVKACRLLPGDAWWGKDGARRGLASLSPEVVRRVLATGLSPAQEARVARALGERGDRPPSPLGSLLPAVAAGAEK